MKRAIELTLVLLVAGLAVAGAGTVAADDRSSGEAGPTNTTTTESPSPPASASTVVFIDQPSYGEVRAVTVNPPGEAENRTEASLS